MTAVTPTRAGAVLFAVNCEALAGFYANAIGFEKVQAEAGFVGLERDGFELIVHAIPAHIASQLATIDPPRRKTDTAIKLMFIVADLDEARRAIARHGGRLAPPASEWQFGDWRVVDGHDPEGNVFQIRTFER